MCGIIGYLGREEAQKTLIGGLERLAYRGYDSSGIATRQDNAFQRTRAAGPIDQLKKKLGTARLAGSLGIGHTRWATHGPANEHNAHPLIAGTVAIVHNGIIENHAILRKYFAAKGANFQSDTDSEILALLINEAIQQGATLGQATSKASQRVEGSFAFLAMQETGARSITGVRRGSPLALGCGTDGSRLFGSDAIALQGIAQEIIYLEDGDIAEINEQGQQIWRLDGQSPVRQTRNLSDATMIIGKEGHRHFMGKEIHEQPRALADTLSALREQNRIDPVPSNLIVDLPMADRIVAIACGTAHYATLIGKQWIETLAQIPTDTEIASEFRYRQPVLTAGTQGLVVSQSGETMDTLEAMRLVQSHGLPALAIVNVPDSTIARVANRCLMTRAGPEISVASTKAFTAQLLALLWLAIDLGRRRAPTDAETWDHLDHLLNQVPMLLSRALLTEPTIQQVAKDLVGAPCAFFVGRGLTMPLALEGALKLKELAYIPAEGLAGGEIKHGPIALITEGTPVVGLVPSGPTQPKMISNLAEVAARGAKLILLADAKGQETAKQAKLEVAHRIEVPETEPLLTPFAYCPALQLLAYHTAALAGADIDQPRNLAKSVTVE